MQRAGVAAYMSGHEHDLQHVVKLINPDDDSSEPVWPQHVTSGAGSETRGGEKKYYKGKVSAARWLAQGCGSRAGLGTAALGRCRGLLLQGLCQQHSFKL